MGVYNKIRRAVARYIVNDKVQVNLGEGMVTFSFDDVPDTGFTNGAAILEQHGFRGTFYVAMGFYGPGSIENRGYNPDLLGKAVANHHELACHTHSHLHCYQSGKEAISHDIQKNQERLSSLIPEARFTNFSYPYGEQTIAAKKVAKELFGSARGVNSGINAGTIDRVNLLAYQLGPELSLTDAKRLIDEAISKKGWLIFFTHEVEEGHGKYGCSPTLLEDVVAYCASQHVRVVTVDEGIQRLNKTAKQ